MTKSESKQSIEYDEILDELPKKRRWFFRGGSKLKRLRKAVLFKR